MSTDAASTTRVLQTAPPLPMLPVNWHSGWRSVVAQGVRLHALRTAAVTSLFETEKANATCLQNATEIIEAYGNGLATVCVDGLPLRCHGLVFTWCFPAEEAADGKVIMRSSLVAFEYMCTMCAASVVCARAAMSYYIANDDDAARACFRHAVAMLQRLIDGIEGHIVVNAQQWSRLRRQALPLQLHVEWLSYFQASISHRHHMCCMLRVINQGDNLPALHGVEIVAFRVFVAAR